VVDASDRDRISEAREELSVLLKSEELWNAAVLVFANKQDLPGALTPAEITEKLGLHDVRGQPWYVQGACAPTADGLDEGEEPRSAALTSLIDRIELAYERTEEEVLKGQQHRSLFYSNSRFYCIH
jgi:ADP-ribosylation factor family